VDRLDQYGIRGTQDYAKNIQTLCFPALQGRPASWSVSQEYRPPAKTLVHLLTGHIRNDFFLAGDAHGNLSAVEAERNSDDALRPTYNIHAIPLHDQAILVGFDGWHLPRAKLDVFPEPQIAYHRSGSH